MSSLFLLVFLLSLHILHNVDYRWRFSSQYYVEHCKSMFSLLSWWNKTWHWFCKKCVVFLQFSKLFQNLDFQIFLNIICWNTYSIGLTRKCIFEVSNFSAFVKFVVLIFYREKSFPNLNFSYFSEMFFVMCLGVFGSFLEFYLIWFNILLST